MKHPNWTAADVRFYLSSEGYYICEGTALEGLCGFFESREEAIQHLRQHEDLGHNVGRTLLRLLAEEDLEPQDAYGMENEDENNADML